MMVMTEADIAAEGAYAAETEVDISVERPSGLDVMREYDFGLEAARKSGPPLHCGQPPGPGQH